MRPNSGTRKTTSTIDVKNDATSVKNNWKIGSATQFILKFQRVQLLIHKKKESNLLGDDFGSSSGSNKVEGDVTSWLEELKEKCNTDNQQTNFPNEIMETVLGVTDVNSPSDDAAAAKEWGTVVNGAGNVSQFFVLSKKFNFNCKDIYYYFCSRNG